MKMPHYPAHHRPIAAVETGHALSLQCRFGMVENGEKNKPIITQ